MFITMAAKNKESFCEALIGELQNSALLISPNWVNNTDDFNEFIIRCKKKGIKLLFSKDFHWNFLLMIKILFSALSKLHYVSLNGNRVATLRMTFLAIHTFINETVNLSNFSASYVLTYEDQFLGHIIKKKMYNDQKYKSLRVQHSAGNGLFGNPTLAFIDFDLYFFVWNNLTYQLYSKYWATQRCDVTNSLPTSHSVPFQA